MKGFPAEIRPENRYSAGDHEKNIKKISKKSIFSFFSKLAENWFNCQFWVLNHFKTPLRPFSGHFRSRKSILNIRKKSIFFHENLDFCDFLDFLNFDDAIDNSAGTGRKCEIWPEMGPLDPQDTSSYLVCYHMSNRKSFTTFWKKSYFWIYDENP